jgi:DNA-binding NarL/FixJ family response regulator
LTQDGERDGLRQVGLVVTDPLRLAGFQAVLADKVECEVVLLSGLQPLRAATLELILIDSSATDHLFELLASFRRLRPLIRLIVIGLPADPEHIQRIIAAGAKGYVSYSAAESELRMAIEIVRDGSVWAPRKVLARLLEDADRRHSRPEEEAVRFTPRELEVLKLLVLGHSNRELARVLKIDEGTVKAHLSRMMRKAGVDNRTALSVRAMAMNWIPLGPE